MENWKHENKKLYRKFQFRDFLQAMSFMNKVAEVAQLMDHHPEWKNVYNNVEVWLCTHSAGNTVTDKDKGLAKKMDQVFENFQKG